MQDITDEEKNAMYNDIQIIQPQQQVQYQDTQQDKKNENKEFEEIRQKQIYELPSISIQQMIQQHPSEYFFGIQLDVQSISENPFEIQNLKRTLINNIQNSGLITTADKNSWISILEETQDLKVIYRIQSDFNKTSDKARVDTMAKEIIVFVARFLNQNYFNGEYKIFNSIKLPDMNGSENDFIDFYSSGQIQTFMQQDVRGVKIQKIMSNPGVELMAKLTLRGIRNTMNKKNNQLVSPKMDYNFNNEFANIQ